MPSSRPISDHVKALATLTKAEVAAVEWSPQQLLDERPLRFFVSYAHADRKLREDLVDRLQVHLNNHPAFRFELWTDGDIILGQSWMKAIERAMETCDFGLLLVSPRFFSSKFIRNHELPWLLENKPVIPVALRKLVMGPDSNLRGLESVQIFFHHQRAFIERTTEKTKDDFAIELYRRICLGLNEPERLAASSKAGFPENVRLTIEDFDTSTFVAPEGIESSLYKGIEPAPSIDTKVRKNALEFLTEWIEDPQGPPYCALLGETGIGKTTTCKALAKALLERRDQGEPAPLPIFLDLRQIGGGGKDLVLEEILDRILKRSWRGGPRRSSVSVDEMVELICDQPTLVIWDGLDEVLVHLTDNEGQLFTRQLFRILPPRSEGERRPGRMLITCRTHYFRTLRDQQTHLRGEDRDDIREEDYRAPFLLLPFTPEQIRLYVQSTLPDENPDRVMEVLASVHNLREMAERPYTLSLIVQQFATLERWKREGRRVTGVSLYRHLVLSWLERDRGKHQLTPDHKQALMEHLAAALWRSGQLYWTVETVEQWLIDFLRANDEVAAHYHGIGREQLKEDLRTATFLVRDGEDQFRFAHTSLQEFFLAGYLKRALIDGRPDRWRIGTVSWETLEFLGQWLEESEANRSSALATLSQIRDSYTPQASELALMYCLLAIQKGFVAPSTDGFQMATADLTGWVFTGSRESPLPIGRINLSGARLRYTRWLNCDMQCATLTGADATRAEFMNCQASNSEWSRANIDGAIFRDCDLRYATFAATSSRRTQWIRTDIPGCLTDTASGNSSRVIRSNDSEFKQQSSSIWVAGGHLGAVTACAWSPDGSRVVSASADKTLRIWDGESGQNIMTLVGHKGEVLSCSWSPDGKQIVSSSTDHTVRIWDVASGQTVHTLIGHQGVVFNCRWSPDGMRIASASGDTTVCLWGVISGQRLAILLGHQQAVMRCAWSPDGMEIVSAGADSEGRIWNADSGKEIRRLIGHTKDVMSCAWSPSGGRVLTAGADSTLRIWDSQTGICLRTLVGHQHPTYDCAWSPDGTRVLSAAEDATVRLWNADTGESLGMFVGHHRTVFGVDWSADGMRVVTASEDGTLRIWDPDSCESVNTLVGGEVPVHSVAWSPAHLAIVTGLGDNTLQKWDTNPDSGVQSFVGHEGSVYECAWSPDARQVVSASTDTTIRIWDVDSGHLLRALIGHKAVVSCCAWSPDGTRVLSASWDRTMRIWDAATGSPVRILNCRAASIRSCAWSPDGSLVLSGDRDGKVRLWDAESGQHVGVIATLNGPVFACTWSPDGTRIATAGWDARVRVFEANSGRILETFVGHRGCLYQCSWSPDSKRILSCSRDGTLRIWYTWSTSDFVILTGHEAEVRACSWSHDGSLVASGSRDGTIRIWDPLSGTELQRICLRISAEGRTWVTIDANDNRVVTCHSEGWRILGWRVSETDCTTTVLPGEAYGPLPVAAPNQAYVFPKLR
jgi:WD40 repeat protein/uncharacterized protein YjbI with pentapeptide repeats